MSDIQIQIPKHNVVLYFFVAHGGNLSFSNNYYRTNLEHKIKSFLFYSSSNESINEVFLVNTFNKKENICDLLSRNAVMIQTDNTTYKSYMYLPSLFFKVKNEDNEYMRSVMGLYRIVLGKFSDDCQLHQLEKIVGYDYLLTLKNFTYTHIFDLIYKSCKIKKDTIENICVGIYCCQSRVNYFKDTKNLKIEDIVPSFIEEPRKAIISNPLTINDKHISLTIVTNIDDKFVEIKKEFLSKYKDYYNKVINNLADKTLFLLSYYKIIDEVYAREKTLCITSYDKRNVIFNVINYIHSYGKPKNNIMVFDETMADYAEDEYIVCKLDVTSGLNIILNSLSQINGNSLVIFTLILQDGTTYNTVSLYRNMYRIMYIDIINGINIEIKDINSFIEYIKKTYTNITHVGCIFTVNKDEKRFNDMNMLKIENEYRSYLLNNIIVENNLQMGGGRRRIKKTYNKTRRTKKNKSNKKL
jgi:hypothetical protein